MKNTKLFFGGTFLLVCLGLTFWYAISGDDKGEISAKKQNNSQSIEMNDTSGKEENADLSDVSFEEGVTVISGDSISEKQFQEQVENSGENGLEGEDSNK